MNHDDYDESYAIDILRNVKTIALVGASSNEARASHGVMKFLISKNYKVIPVNPGLVGETLLGQKVYASLSEIPGHVDMVDIFRNSEAAGIVTDEALALSDRPTVIWMQLGVRHDAAAARAEAAGLKVVMNRCPKIEIAQHQL